MGAKALLLFRPSHGGAPTSADAEQLIAALHRVCGVTQSRQADKHLEARCTRLAQAPARDLSVVNNPRSLADLWALQLPREAPDRVFLCNTKACQLVEADAAIASGLLDKRLDYRTRAAFGVSSRTWLLGDRRHSDAAVKLLQVQAHGQAPLAVALEVSYSPASSVSEAAPVLAELSEALMGALQASGDAAAGRLEPLPPPWAEYAAWLPPEPSPAHTAALYVALMTSVLRDRGGPAAQRAAAAAAAATQQRPAAAAAAAAAVS